MINELSHTEMRQFKKIAKQDKWRGQPVKCASNTLFSTRVLLDLVDALPDPTAVDPDKFERIVQYFHQCLHPERVDLTEFIQYLTERRAAYSLNSDGAIKVFGELDLSGYKHSVPPCVKSVERLVTGEYKRTLPAHLQAEVTSRDKGRPSDRCRAHGISLVQLARESGESEQNLINWHGSDKARYRRRFDLVLKGVVSEHHLLDRSLTK